MDDARMEMITIVVQSGQPESKLVKVLDKNDRPISDIKQVRLSFDDRGTCEAELVTNSEVRQITIVNIEQGVV